MFCCVYIVKCICFIDTAKLKRFYDSVIETGNLTAKFTKFSESSIVLVHPLL